MAPLEWYYAKDNAQHGPVSAVELKQLADRGQLGPGDLVWREGMGDWIPAKKVKGLFEEEGPAAPAAAAPVEAPPKAAPVGGAPPTFERSTTAFARSRQQPARHLFDHLLEFARGQFTSQFIESTSRIFTFGGHYGLYLAVGVLLAFNLFLGVKTNQVNIVLLGMAEVVILLVLQYVASRFSAALERLNRSTPARMSSAAYLDCYALLNMFGGLVVLLGLAVLAVQTGLLSLVLPAIAVFILCQYVAILALNPESLGLSIAPEATAGEEAIGVLSFLVKLSLRLVPVAFGVGVVWGTITLLYAAFLVLAPPEDPGKAMGFLGPDAPPPMFMSDDSSRGELLKLLPAQVTASTARWILIGSAALPFVAYVLFLVLYLSIDLMRAVLAVPQKLDKLKEPGEGEAEG